MWLVLTWFYILNFDSFCKSVRKIHTKNNRSDNYKYTSNYKKEYVLNTFQREALIGLILGDGFLERTKPHHNTRLRIEQSYPEKKQYFDHLYLLFEPMVGMDPSIIERKADKRTGLVYKSIFFWTLKFLCLNEFYEMFYKNKVKTVPNNLGELLTPVGLAYWIMDDGGKSFYGQTILHTRSFTKNEVKFIQTVLKNNFGLVTRIEEKKLNQWIIYTPLKQDVKFINIVGKYIHESMLYKVQ